MIPKYILVDLMRIFFIDLGLKSGYWTDYELVSTDSTADSLEPSIDIDSENTVYIVWEEMMVLLFLIIDIILYLSKKSK